MICQNTAPTALFLHRIPVARYCRYIAASLVFMASPQSYAADASRTDDAGNAEAARIVMTVKGQRFNVTLANTAAARQFVSMLPLTLEMEDLNGNEKKKELAEPLPVDKIKPGKIRNGDLLLWGAETVVVFYQTFSSSYSYTPLGHVDNPAALPSLLGEGDVRVEFSSD